MATKPVKNHTHARAWTPVPEHRPARGHHNPLYDPPQLPGGGLLQYTPGTPRDPAAERAAAATPSKELANTELAGRRRPSRRGSLPSEQVVTPETKNCSDGVPEAQSCASETMRWSTRLCQLLMCVGAVGMGAVSFSSGRSWAHEDELDVSGGAIVALAAPILLRSGTCAAMGCEPFQTAASCTKAALDVRCNVEASDWACADDAPQCASTAIARSPAGLRTTGSRGQFVGGCSLSREFAGEGGSRSVKWSINWHPAPAWDNARQREVECSATNNCVCSCGDLTLDEKWWCARGDGSDAVCYLYRTPQSRLVLPY